MIQDKTLSAEKGCSLVKENDKLLNHLASSLRASREGVVRGCRFRAPTVGTPPDKDAPLPARCAFRSAPSRLAETTNTILKEY